MEADRSRENQEIVKKPKLSISTNITLSEKEKQIFEFLLQMMKVPLSIKHGQKEQWYSSKKI